MMNGLGCSCNESYLGAVTDVITIGGKQYSVDSLLNKVLVASGPVKIFANGNFTTPIYTVARGQSVGMVYSYIRPSATNGGRALLMFDSPTETWPNGAPKAYYAGADNIDTSVLKDSGVLTLEEQVKEEQAQAEKENDPIVYYAKKLLVPGILIIGGIYAFAQLGSTYIKQKTTPAMSGPRYSSKSKSKKRKVKKL